jgi:tetratricopeptide (TPR) repeat protein
MPSDANGRALGGSVTHSAVAALATVADRVDTMTGRAFVLAEKGALYSAKAEFHQALRAIAQSLGAQSGSKRFSTAMALGLQALDEADDFATYAQNGPVVNVELIVDAHQTPLLKPYDLSNVPPVVAMQRYYTFAQEQLVTACGGAPVAARVFYGLGKLHMVLGAESATAERLHGPKAMAFHQTALIIDPMNYLAANELGVLLARFGKFPEARTVLEHSVAIRPLPETWQNLTVVHPELGEMQLAAQSEANWQYAVQQRQESGSSQLPAQGSSMVQWVPPQQFMGMPGGPPVATPPQRIQERQPEQAKQKTGFLWW